MSARTSAELIESYLGRLRAELSSAGAAGIDDLVAEVRSMLVEAAGEDSDRAASEIAELGDPAELAAGILAERGLSPEGAMSTAEWWRMGIAVPVDILIGLSVPIAAFFPLWSLTQMAREGGTASAFAASGLAVLALGTLWWPWYVWRPWRTGGRPATAGMALTGIAVVRAPGFWKVVKASDLEALGLAPSRRTALSGAVTLAFALVLLAFFASALGSQMQIGRTGGTRADLAGPAQEQEQGARDAVETLYATMASPTAGTPANVASCAAASYASLAGRLAERPGVKPQITAATMLEQGVWTVEVLERVGAETRKVTFTVNRRVVLQAQGEDRDWVITDIAGEGLARST